MPYRFWVIFFYLGFALGPCFWAMPKTLDTISQRESFEDYLTQWEKIELRKVPLPEAEGHFVIITNRAFYPDSAIFMSDFLPKKNRLHYLLCQVKEGQKTVTPLSNLAAALPYLPKNQNFLVFIHGDGRTFPRVFENSRKLNVLYGLNVLAFDYPSKKMNKNPLSNYWLSRKNIENSLSLFQAFLEELRDLQNHFLQGQKVSIMAHSLGGYLLERYLKTTETSHLPHFEHLIWMLTAVKTRHHAQWMRKEDLPTRNYVLYSQKDLVLKTAEMLGFTKFLGTTAGKKLAEGTFYIDLTTQTKIFHTPYDKFNLLKRRTQLFDLFRALFNGEELTENNTAFNLMP